MSLYHKYRPSTFDQVIGAEVAVATLEAHLASKTVPHAILFHGPAGCGKTTLARILRHELGCHDLDFCEMNSANYRGIDSIRKIQGNMSLAATGGKVRVWLLDEVHMLSGDAQNAALKMLEDTPPHVYFLLCTTHKNKLIDALQTRPTPLAVRDLTYDELTTLLNRVCKAEKITTVTDAVKDELAAAALGSARRLLVLLDKVYKLPPKLQMTAVQEGAPEDAVALDLFKSLIDKRPWKTVAAILQNLKADPEEVRWAILGLARYRLLKDGNARAFDVIASFQRNFYDSKAAGLAGSCYEVIHAA